MWRKLTGLLISLAFSVGLAHAATIPQPTSDFFVYDGAHVLSADTYQTLQAQAVALEASTGSQLVVVTIPTLDDQDIESFATQLFRDWGIGSRERNDGVLLLLAIQDHQYRLEIGYGLEGAIPDGVAGSIGRQFLVPNLKNDDYDTAVLQATAALVKLMVGEAVASDYATEQLTDTAVAILPTLVMIFAIAFFSIGQHFAFWRRCPRCSLRQLRRRTKHLYGNYYHEITTCRHCGYQTSRRYYSSSASSSGHSSSGGGGGHSGGGGSSGGGGASGSW